MIAGALFGGAAWVAPSAYFVGIAAVVVSGLLLKKTKLFEGDVAPFVMELPAYHMPPLRNILRTTWERGWSFIKKAGTIILLSSMVLWFLQNFGFENGSFGMIEDLNNSILAIFGNTFAWIFSPLGFGNWQSTVAAVTGGLAGMLYGYSSIPQEWIDGDQKRKNQKESTHYRQGKGIVGSQFLHLQPRSQQHGNHFYQKSGKHQCCKDNQ